MLLKLTRPLIFFDLETTGTNPATDRIVQIAAIRIYPDRQKDVFHRRINPTIPIPESTSAVHGITDDDVADCPTFADMAYSLYAFIQGRDLAGFNSNAFDIPLLANEFARAGYHLDLSEVRCVDASAIFRAFERRTLAAAYEFYCGKTLEGAHDALVDVQATIEVLQGQIERYGLTPDVESLSQFGKQPALDPSGKIALNEHGYPVLTFGKYAGKALTEIADEDIGYLQWMLSGEFAETTKSLIRKYA